MKRIIKLLSVLALVGMLGMLFCACDMLDEKKANTAVLSDDMQSVEYNGKTFKRLPDDIPYFFNDTYSNKCITITKEIPVLLSESYGYNSYCDSTNGIFAITVANKWMADGYNSLDGYSTPNESKYIYFGEEKRFDEYTNVNAEDADRIGFYDTGELYYTAIVSSETSKEILDHIKSTDSWSAEAFSESVEQYYETIYPLYQCNKSLTLRKTLYSYEITITTSRETYLIDNVREQAVKLSAEADEDITADYYEYGSGNYFLTVD